MSQARVSEVGLCLEAVIFGVGFLAVGAVLGVAYLLGDKESGIGANVTSKASEDRRAEKAKQRRLEEQRRIEEQRKALVKVAEGLSKELSAQIDMLSDTTAKRSLKEFLQQTLSSCKLDIQRGHTTVKESFREIRGKLLEAKMDEEMASSLVSGFESLVSTVESNMLPGFRSDWKKLLASAKEVQNLPVNRKINQLNSLISKANNFAVQMNKVATFSLEGIVEDIFVVPPPAPQVEAAEQNKDIELMRADIADFGGRIAFFDRQEAEILRPLMEEATCCTSHFRISSIRDQVKTTYGRLKECKVLTELFKQEIRELLPVMKRTKNSESVIVRMEELLSSEKVDRNDFSPLYCEIKTIFAEQLDSLLDDAVARKMGSVLGEMGYSLIAEDRVFVGDPVTSLPPGEICYLESPYKGYRVIVRIDGGKLATRLVRVVANEDEAKAGGEYQCQKDEETGRKWCKDLNAFYDSMEKEGIFLKPVHCKEPGEEPLDVVIDDKIASRHSKPVRESVRQGREMK
ncbi:MAG: hypothetical protein PHU72_00500 [Dethiosulfovibrio sp.]|nr:hypothetical protein [Dethiosulfovibrio sp.]